MAAGTELQFESETGPPPGDLLATRSQRPGKWPSGQQSCRAETAQRQGVRVITELRVKPKVWILLWK